MGNQVELRKLQTVGHFIKHKDGSEPHTHRGRWESSYLHAPEGLGGGSVGLEEGHGRRRGRGTRARTARCSSVGRSTAWGGTPAWGGARASTSKKRSVGLGTAALGAVDECVGNGGACRRMGRGWRRVEMNLETDSGWPMVHHCRF